MGDFIWYAHPLFVRDSEDSPSRLNRGHFTEFLLDPPVLSGKFKFINKINLFNLIINIFLKVSIL